MRINPPVNYQKFKTALELTFGVLVVLMIISANRIQAGKFTEFDWFVLHGFGKLGIVFCIFLILDIILKQRNNGNN